MQAGKNAMASVKETASNIAASAKSGMEKTKATLEEKVGYIHDMYLCLRTFPIG